MGLLAFNKALALPAILGIVLLLSIIIKNSILMTAFGTIAGMIPIAMQRAVGLERLSPLADAAIGGLPIGAMLSLFYLPMFYVWVTGKENR